MIMMANVGRSRRICTSSFRNTANTRAHDRSNSALRFGALIFPSSREEGAGGGVNRCACRTRRDGNSLNAELHPAAPNPLPSRGGGVMIAAQSLEIVHRARHQVDENFLETRFDRRDLNVRLRLLHRPHGGLERRGILAARMNLGPEARNEINAR